MTPDASDPAPSAGAGAQPADSAGSVSLFLTPVDDVSAIAAGVGDDVTEPKGEHHDRDNPEDVEEEPDKTERQSNGEHDHHRDARDPALSEQRGDAVGLLRFDRHQEGHLLKDEATSKPDI